MHAGGVVMAGGRFLNFKTRAELKHGWEQSAVFGTLRSFRRTRSEESWAREAARLCTAAGRHSCGAACSANSLASAPAPAARLATAAMTAGKQHVCVCQCVDPNLCARSYLPQQCTWHMHQKHRSWPYHCMQGRVLLRITSTSRCGQLCVCDERCTACLRCRHIILQQACRRRSH
jgi:hypothetical protein